MAEEFLVQFYAVFQSFIESPRCFDFKTKFQQDHSLHLSFKMPLKASESGRIYAVNMTRYGNATCGNMYGQLRILPPFHSLGLFVTSLFTKNSLKLTYTKLDAAFKATYKIRDIILIVLLSDKYLLFRLKSALQSKEGTSVVHISSATSIY